MNIAKATEILQEHIKISKLDYLPDIRDATKLGIEALKNLKDTRLTYDGHPIYLLPSETED